MMQHLIAFNGFRGGNKGSASCQPLSEYDKTISLPWLHEMVLQIRGEKSIRSVDRADEAKIAKAQQRIKGQLPFRCAHYYRFLKNRRAQDNADPTAFLFQTTVDVDDKEYVEQAIERARELNCSDSIWKGMLLHLEYSARKKLHIDIRMPVGMTIEETQKAYCEALGVPYDESCISPERMIYITDKDSEIYRSKEWYGVLPMAELQIRRDAFVKRGLTIDGRGSRGMAGYGLLAGDCKSPERLTDTAGGERLADSNLPVNGNHQVQSSKFNVQSNEKVQSNDNVQSNRFPGTNGDNAVHAGAAVQPAQPADSHPADDSHLSSAGDNQAAGGVAPLEVFPTEYQGIPYKNLVDKLIVLLGGEPEHGSRNTFIFTLACYLRYLCDDNAAWIKQIIPTFGEEQQRAFSTVDSACNRKQSHRMPSIVRNAIRLVQEADSKAKADGNFDDEDFGDIHNPESYFYNIHQMPQKLPKLIKLLISKTPAIYQPAVSQAVFPPLAAHLCQTRFLYIDNVEHEATLMQILCAPTGSGKESISQPINRIMADIRKRDAEQRERERLWKDECNSKGANKDKRERPAGLVIQEVNIDMTNPAFVLRMKEADNHFLYAKINELNLFDALKGKTNQQFRIMELAFDLGNYGQDRVGTQSVTETVKVRFNWNACCTPKKCRDYFRRVVTDGPISRISFATIERRPCGSEIPVYGTYDAAFDEELRPYIENLVKARGLVNCPQALRLARKLVEENAEFARLSQNYVFENLSFRANVIAYLKACVLYVANGMKWEKSIEDFIRWSERYDLWCKLKLFGQMIYEADNDRSDSPKTAPRGPKNMLLLLPDEFTFEDYIKLRRSQGFEDTSLHNAKCAINQWIYRNYVVKVSLSGEISEDDNNNNNSFVFRKLKYLTNKT